ncbi:carbohydrate porin [Pantoea sp. 1.19]|uniref:carbohydrate porin n=1 Tax=Pantoea sp. 1.19 TaxID=1925589 RepID=UPI0009489C0A|nr:carbohydrate porin [Pantoea sp. 1.19]
MERKTEAAWRIKQCARLTGIATLLLSGAALADRAPFDPDSPWLLGDWGGYRSQLQQDGVDFQVNYTLESAANLAGGYHSATTMRYTDQWAFGTTLDLDKLLNWQDTQFQFTITSRNGQDLTPYLNDPRSGGLSSVQEVWGRGQTWRLTQFWLNKGLFDNLLEVKAGRVTVGEDFDSLDSKFENLAFGGGQAGNWRGDRWFNWPVSQWGGRVKLNITPEVFFQVGFYNQNRNNYDRGNGFYLDGSPTLGNLVPVELGWKPLLGANKLPGNYRLGFYYSSVDGDVWHSYDRGDYGQSAHAYGGYVLAQQQLFAMDGDNTRGLTLAVQAVMNDHKTSKTDNYQSISLVWKGPFASRSEDEIGLGAARIHVNDDYGRMQRQVNNENQVHDYRNPTYLPVQKGSEYNYELYYNLHATPWLSVRPSLQYVASPGAVSQVKDAFVGGISANINF